MNKPIASRRDFLTAGAAALGAMAVAPSLVQAATTDDKAPSLVQAAATSGKAPSLVPAATTDDKAPAEAHSTERKLTLHAIDTYFGQTNEGLRIDLSILDGDGYRLLKTVTTEPRGRTAEPLLVDDELKAGRYELLLHLDEYFARVGAELPKPAFLGKVPIRFGVREGERFHVPILFSPWSYSYYRGS